MMKNNAKDSPSKDSAMQEQPNQENIQDFM